MDNNNKLIPLQQNSLIPKVTNTLNITNKLIIENNKNLVMEIFERNPKLFIDLISCYYPLNDELLHKHKDKLDWREISRNESIKWSYLIEKYENKLHKNFLNNKSIPLSIEILDKYKTILNWDGLSHWESISWSIELISKFEDKWNWEEKFICEDDEEDYDSNWYCVDNGLSSNKLLPWSIEIIEKFENKWNWMLLSSNESIPWSIELIEKFLDKWKWNNLSLNKKLPWTIEFIEKYEEKWGWKYLSYNEAIPWSFELIEKYKNRLHWRLSREDRFHGLSNNQKLPWSIELLENYKDYWDWNGLSQNESIPWTLDLIEKYEEKWNWKYMSKNESIPWSAELIEKYTDKWNWYSLNYLKKIPWSVELIEKHIEKLNFKYLENNKNIPWSIKFIETYKYKWVWQELNDNESIPWNIELIEKFENKWNWNRLSCNKSIPWNEELIKKFEDKWDWDRLSDNRSIIWTIDLLEKFKNKWNWEILSDNYSNLYTLDMIKQFESKWNWKKLSKNNNLPWSIKFINNNFSKLSNYFLIWKTLQPYTDDEMIKEFFEKTKTIEKKASKVKPKIVKKATLLEAIRDVISSPEIKTGTVFIAGATKAKDYKGVHQMILEVVQKKQLTLSSNPAAIKVLLKITRDDYDKLFTNIGISGRELQELTADLTKDEVLMTFARVRSINVEGKDEIPTISVKQYSAEEGLPNKIQKILDIEESERTDEQDRELAGYEMRTKDDEALVDLYGNQVYELNKLTHDEEENIFIKKMPLSEYEKKLKK